MNEIQKSKYDKYHSLDKINGYTNAYQREIGVDVVKPGNYIVHRVEDNDGITQVHTFIFYSKSF